MHSLSSIRRFNPLSPFCRRVLTLLQLALIASIACSTASAESVYTFTTLASTFELPQRISVDKAGNIYVTELFQSRVRKITPAGIDTVLAGDLGQVSGVDVDESGNVYVVEGFNRTINKITPAGAVSLVAGALGVTGSADGTGAAAQFNAPSGVAVDKTGVLYVADTYNHTIRKIATNGGVTTFAGTASTRGGADGAGASASFNQPTDVGVDDQGTVYVADSVNHMIRKISPAGQVTTLAGSAGLASYADGVGAAARFNSPQGLDVDAAGNVFVADTDNHVIRQITSDGQVTTIAGLAGTSGSADGTGAEVRFNRPDDVAVDQAGNLYVLDTNNGRIRKGLLQTVSHVTWANPADITYGTALSSIQLSATADVPGTFSYTPASGSVLNAGTTTLSVTFTPTDPKYTTVTKTVSLSVQKLAPTLTWATPSPIAEGTPLSSAKLNATANVPGVFSYSPDLGAILDKGTHTLTVTFTPTDSVNYRVVTLGRNITVGDRTFEGTYFGGFSDGSGKWALKVNADGTGTFIAHLPERPSIVVANFAIDATGHFNFTGTDIVPAQASEGIRALTAGSSKHSSAAATSGFTLNGQIAAGAVSGTLTGVSKTFSGVIDDAGGAAASGFYTASALNTATGATYAIVAPSGRALAVMSSSAGVDSATGTVNGGQLTTTTAGGAQLALALNSATHSAAVNFTPQSGAPIKFAGLSADTAVTTRIVNLSVRSRAGKDDRTLIMGFVIAGSGAKQALVRGLGPLLTQYGVDGALADPQLRLYSATAGLIDSNNDWGGSATLTQSFAALGASALAGGSKDAALLRELSPGVYSTHVTTADAATGVALAEIYDADKTGGRLVNVSARSEARTGSDILVAGFVLEGNAPKTLLIRGLGPTLGALGVAGALVDPHLKLYDQAGVLVAENGDWGGSSTLKATFTAVGAATLASDASKDAALLVTLPPGVYSAHVSGENGTTGIALVEVYEVP